MLRSFKLKMALFAVCTSGVILLAFAMLFMSVIRRVGNERIDRHLVALSDSQMRRPFPPEHWSLFEENLSFLYGENNQRPFLVKVIDRNGKTVYVSPRWPAAFKDTDFALPPPEEPPERQERPPPNVHPFRLNDEPPPHMRPLSKPLFSTLRAGNKTWRFVAACNHGTTLLIGTDTAGLQTEFKRFRTAFSVACPLGLFLLAAGGWLLAEQALRPVRILTRIAAGITAKGLSQRVQVPDADREFQAMIEVLNGMLDRLEKSFNQAARFSADAAHELKTPLTILQGQLNQALQNAPSDSDQQRTYADLLEEVQRLKSIVRKLLLLAQSDSGQLRLSLERVCLTDEIEALTEDFPVLAPGLTFHKELAPDVEVMADPDLIRQVVQNLFSNAVKYGREGGTVECGLRQDAKTVTLTLANMIPPPA